ncbi:hypothetical protein EIP91_002821 [Steccherinum ochraceum]|uniref:Protein kinase domain-containing protein n=1 Tax=Steccherinum ochraceum TaxID=92696 RepID=A0A4R0RDX0_9APHY|nr:hypothetical protein EIP91_002821 [Steccherinum ochraceum]
MPEYALRPFATANPAESLPRPISQAPRPPRLVPPVYQRSAILNVHLNEGDSHLELEVLKPFPPTCAQACVARQTKLPSLPNILIVKVFDPMVMKRSKRHPTYSFLHESAAAERRGDQSQPELVRSLSLGDPRLQDSEDRLVHSWDPNDEGIYPPISESENEDPTSWEEHYFKISLQQFHKERRAYERLSDLQGILVPRFYGCGRLGLPGRPIMPRVVLLEYIRDALPLDAFSVLSPHHKSLMAFDGPDADAGIYKQFWSHGVVQNDVGHRQVSVTRDHIMVFDFGRAMLREPDDTDEEWDWLYRGVEEHVQGAA